MRAHVYQPGEVREIILRSDGSEPPPGTGWRSLGHTSEHVNPGKGRLAEMTQAHLRRNPNSAKSSYLNLGDQVRVITELLNSAEGQAKLKELDDGGPGSTAAIKGDLTSPVTIHFNMSGMRDDTRKIPWSRFVVLVAWTPDGIYIHTSYADMIIT